VKNFNYIIGANLELIVTFNKTKFDADLIEIKQENGLDFEIEGIFVTQGDGTVLSLEEDIKIQALESK